MSLELLQPVAEVLSGLALHPPQVLGKNIQIHTEATGFPELNEVRIAVVGVAEIRNSYFEQAHFDAAAFRKAWYALYPGNWQRVLPIWGSLGASVEDTYQALKDICLHLRQINIIPVVIGEVTILFTPYTDRFEKTQQLVNIVSVDNQFDFRKEEELISGRSYMSRIMEQPNYLITMPI